MKYKPWQVFQDFDSGAVQLKQIYKVPLFLLFVSSDRSFYSNNVLLVPPKWLRLPRFGGFGGTKNGTSGARIKIPRPLFNTN